MAYTVSNAGLFDANRFRSLVPPTTSDYAGGVYPEVYPTPGSRAPAEVGLKEGGSRKRGNFLNLDYIGGDTSQLKSLVPAALSQRDEIVRNLMRQLEGPSYEDFFTGGASQGAANKYLAGKGAIDASLTARGLVGSGLETRARRGLLKQYASDLFRGVSGAQAQERDRTTKLLGSLGEQGESDIDFLSSVATGQLGALRANYEQQFQDVSKEYDRAKGIGEVVQMLGRAVGNAYSQYQAQPGTYNGNYEGLTQAGANANALGGDYNSYAAGGVPLGATAYNPVANRTIAGDAYGGRYSYGGTPVESSYNEPYLLNALRLGAGY